MPEIRSSDKGKEIVTSPAKKIDLIKREYKEKLTLRRKNEYLLGGTDKGATSKQQGTTKQWQTILSPRSERQADRTVNTFNQLFSNWQTKKKNSSELQQITHEEAAKSTRAATHSNIDLNQEPSKE